MKTLLFLLALFASSALADQYALQWDYGTNPISGFKLYCGTATGVYPATPAATLPATTKTATVTVPAGTRQFCVVRAYDAVAESPNSNEVNLYGRPDAPTNLRVTLTLTWNPITGEVLATVDTVN